MESFVSCIVVQKKIHSASYSLEIRPLEIHSCKFNARDAAREKNLTDVIAISFSAM